MLSSGRRPRVARRQRGRWTLAFVGACLCVKLRSRARRSDCCDHAEAVQPTARRRERERGTLMGVSALVLIKKSALFLIASKKECTVFMAIQSLSI